MICGTKYNSCIMQTHATMYSKYCNYKSCIHVPWEYLEHPRTVCGTTGHYSIIKVSTFTTGTLLLLVILGTVVTICIVYMVVNMRRQENKGTHKYYEHLDSVKNYTKAYIAVSVILCTFIHLFSLI